MKTSFKILIVSLLVMLFAIDYMNKFPSVEAEDGTKVPPSFYKNPVKAEIYTVIGETEDHQFLIGIPEETNKYTFIFEKKYKIGDKVRVVYTGVDNIISEHVIGGKYK